MMSKCCKIGISRNQLTKMSFDSSLRNSMTSKTTLSIKKEYEIYFKLQFHLRTILEGCNYKTILRFNNKLEEVIGLIIEISAIVLQSNFRL
jgi:hypothetical protein